jgi:asparagine synthase (glutamine-hydrolysing)
LLAAIKDKGINLDRKLYENLFGGHYVAFVISKLRRELYALRDVTGAKSAYYAESKNGLTIGTNMHEVVQFVNMPTLNREGALHIMTIDYLFDGETFYRDVNELPMGSLSVSKGCQPLKVARRFSLDLADAENGKGVETNIRSLREGILQAHAKRAGAENVVLLSGGIDSSVMLCALREVVDRTRVRAITFRVKGTPEDETGYAISLAKHLGVEIERIEVEPHDPALVQNFERDIKQMNSPYYGRFIFGQFKGSPHQVYFAGQDTRLHTPDLNQVDKLAFSTLAMQRKPFTSGLLKGISKLADPLVSLGFASSEKRWQRGLFRAALAFDLDCYLPRFFFKLNPENLRADGYNECMIADVLARVKVQWREAKNQRHLYNLIVATKWGEQYTDDMRYLQDVARANNTHIALPFYDIDLARLSSALPFNQASRFMQGRAQFDNQRVVVNKFLLREAFRNELNEALLLRAKAVSRSQYLLFSGVLGKRITRELQVDLSRGSYSIIRLLGLNQLAARFLGTASYRPEDEVFLTKIYWLGIVAHLGSDKKIG